MAGIGRRAIGWGAAGVVAALGAVALAVGVPVPGMVLNLDTALPPGFSETHGSVAYHVLSGRTEISGLAVFDHGTEIASASSLVAVGYGAEGGAVRLRSLDLRDAAIWSDGHQRWTAATVSVHGLRIAPGAAVPMDADGVLALAKRVSFDALSAGTIAGTPQQGNVTISSVTVKDYAGGAMGHLLARDSVLTLVPIQTPARTFTVQETEVRNSPADWWSGQGFAGLSSAVSGPARPNLVWQMLGISLVSQPCTINFDAIRATETFTGNGSSHGTVTTEGGMMHLSAAALANPRLRTLGLDGAALAGGVDETFDAPAMRVAVTRMEVSVGTLGTLSMSSSLVIDRDAAARAGADRLARLKAIVLEHASIRWEDAGLVDRVLGQSAAEAGIGVEQMRQVAEQKMQQLGGFVPSQPDLGTQLSAFIAQPHVLVLSIDPPLPVAIGAVLGMPDRQANAVLGLRVSAQ
jgi:hypothetical protein